MEHAILTAIAVLACALAALLVLFLLRVRSLAGRVGAFECALRLPGQRRWTSGIAVFGDSSITWSNLISLSLRPRYTWQRSGLSLEGLEHRGRSGQIVDVSCLYRGEPMQLAMVEDSHSALVAWLESAPPHQPTLF